MSLLFLPLQLHSMTMTSHFYLEIIECSLLNCGRKFQTKILRTFPRKVRADKNTYLIFGWKKIWVLYYFYLFYLFHFIYCFLRNEKLYKSRAASSPIEGTVSILLILVMLSKEAFLFNLFYDKLIFSLSIMSEYDKWKRIEYKKCFIQFE